MVAAAVRSCGASLRGPNEIMALGSAVPAKPRRTMTPAEIRALAAERYPACTSRFPPCSGRETLAPPLELVEVALEALVLPLAPPWSVFPMTLHLRDQAADRFARRQCLSGASPHTETGVPSLAEPIGR